MPLTPKGKRTLVGLAVLIAGNTLLLGSVIASLPQWVGITALLTLSALFILGGSIHALRDSVNARVLASTVLAVGALLTAALSAPRIATIHIQETLASCNSTVDALRKQLAGLHGMEFGPMTDGWTPPGPRALLLLATVLAILAAYLSYTELQERGWARSSRVATLLQTLVLATNPMLPLVSVVTIVRGVA